MCHRGIRTASDAIGTGASASEEELRSALEHLGRKYTELGEVMMAYMGEAGTERSVRNANALEMVGFVERIVGGRPVSPGGYPECCLLGATVRGMPDWFCTGVLIHPRVVLTAAHCLERQPIEFVAFDTIDWGNIKPANVVGVRRNEIHPRYRPATDIFDIAVLVLQKDAPVAPVPVASTAQITASKGTTLVGFGNDDVHSTRGFGIKRYVDVPILHLRRRPQDRMDAAEQALGFESDLEFVAGGGGYDSCNGDSGGPAYVFAGAERRVAGLTSRAIRNAPRPCGGGGIYTRVDVHADFIADVMGATGMRAKRRRVARA